MKYLQPTEYMYASARIRALENHLVGGDRVEALLDARSADEVWSRLAELGVAQDVASEGGETVAAQGEGVLLAVLRTAYKEAEDAVPEPSVFRYFRYPYDCNNLKAALKCRVRGVDPADMLFDFGTVPASDVERCVREDDYAAFPPQMAASAGGAAETYAKTGDPRVIDTIVDRACYEDMLRDAEAGDPVLAGWVKAKIDLVNIMICLRLIRMKRGELGRVFLGESLLAGGTLDKRFLDELYTAGEDALWSALYSTRYADLSVGMSHEVSLAAVEKRADDCLMRIVREDARVPFGAAVVGGYLVGCETAVKNIRMIIAAKEAGLDNAVIRERIRESYV